MKKIVLQFVDSWHELKHLRTIVITAMFTAIGVILGFMFTIQLTDFLKIGLSSLANELTALVFGPVVGGLMGGVADIIKFVLKPTGAYFFGFTLNAILGPMIYGVIFYHRPITFRRILWAKLLVAVFVNLLLGTLWLSVMYGKGFIGLLPARAVKQVCSVPVEAFIFYLLAKALERAKVFQLLKN